MSNDNVDQFRAEMFAEIYKEAGGSIEVHKYTGQPHTFAAKNPDDPSAKDAIAKLIAFILAQEG